LAGAPPRATLVRAIGRWDLTAAIVNGVIGSGIFGMPSTVAALVGAWSPVAVLLAGLGIFAVVLCFAEVGSRFDDAGGPYLYTREAFGPAVGFQVGWLNVWTRLLSGAAVLNVFVAYLAQLVPAVGTPAGRAVAMILAVALVTTVNVVGVRQAASTVNLFTVAKLLPLLLLIVVGILRLRPEVLATQEVASSSWTEAVLLLMFLYGGFESSVVAASETRRPRRDTAFALIVGMGAVTVVYALAQLAVVGLLPRAAQSATPVASALGEVLGGVGATIGSVGAVVSGYGWLVGFSLMTPRILIAMADRNELPGVFGRVHPRFRTPHVAIVANSAIALGLALYGDFAGSATLAAITRLGAFGLTCGALLVFRKRRAEPPGFRLPGGVVIAPVGMALCIWLLATRSLEQAWSLVALMALGFLFWRRSRRPDRARPRVAPAGEDG
jgi:amino acid transporter